MAKLTEKTEIDALADNDLLYIRDASAPSDPDKKITGAKLKRDVANPTGATQEATPDDGDILLIWDVDDPANHRKWIFLSQLRPVGAKITHHRRFAGNIAIPNIAADEEQDATIAVAGAAVGDHVVFNPSAPPPAGLIVSAGWVSAADTVTIRFRNAGSGAFAAANLACVALVSRSTA